MKQTVHILATVRKPELLDAARLVFRTIRTGFPTAEIKVWGHWLGHGILETLTEDARSVGAEISNMGPSSHDRWIEALLNNSTSPFWICDTDIVFWEPIEAWFDPDYSSGCKTVAYAGRYEPAFEEEWTDTLHIERLHTSLMYFNPELVRTVMRKFIARIPLPWRDSADVPFIRQHFVPVLNGRTLFYDTCAGLYQAAPGREFTEAQNDAFDHLHCATYADVIQLAGVNLKESHSAIYLDHNLARGIRKQQDMYYTERRKNL